jgi:hypothetical protein
MLAKRFPSLEACASTFCLYEELIKFGVVSCFSKPDVQWKKTQIELITSDKLLKIVSAKLELRSHVVLQVNKHAVEDT